MKKIFKVIAIIAIIGVVIIGGYGSFCEIKSKILDLKNDYERINDSKTLSDYIEHHSSEYLHSSEYALNFIAKNVKCSSFDKNIKYYNNKLLILDDNSIYEVITGSDKLYSNNEQCKEIEPSIIIDDVKNVSGYIYNSGDDLYLYNTYSKEFENYNNFKNNSYYKLYLLGYTNISAYDGESVYAIKDGNIVSLNYKNDVVSDEKVIYSKDKYGYIKEFICSTMIYITPNSFRELDNKIVTSMLTDTSFYVAKMIETDECIKYEDIECNYELVKSRIYERYEEDIKYINTSYAILNDNSIISSNIFSAEFDNEVK